MFFIFVFIFVKIYFIQITIAADVDNPGKPAALRKQDTHSPPRKGRRQTIHTKAVDSEGSEDERIRHDKETLSPFRKGSAAARKSNKENHERKPVPVELPITMLSPPRQEREKSRYPFDFPKRKKEVSHSFSPPTTDVTDDEDDNSDDDPVDGSSTDFLGSSAKGDA